MARYELFYDGVFLISTSVENIEKHYGSPEDWADAYASESGLDRELTYCPSLLCVELNELK